MYLARYGFENRPLNYLLFSIVFILCTESMDTPTSSPTPVRDNEQLARMWGGIVGVVLCVSMFGVAFTYFYPKTSYHHVLHGVDEDQIHRYQLNYFLYSQNEGEIKTERPEHNGVGKEDSPNVELGDFDKDHHRRVDLYQEKAPEPLCEALR